MIKKSILPLLVVFLVGLATCHKSTCPTFDDHAGDKALKGGGKTKSGLFPKGMKH
jgi:hypothetical protein